MIVHAPGQEKTYTYSLQNILIDFVYKKLYDMNSSIFRVVSILFGLAPRCFCLPIS